MAQHARKSAQPYRVRLIILRVFFVVGICIMAYPFASNAVYQFGANDDIDALDTAIEQGDHEGYAAEIARAYAYNAKLVGETVPDVFAIREDTSDEEYESFLNVRGDLMMGSIDIPVIRAHLPIFHYSSEESLLKGCGHIFGSSLPVGGESTHTVLTAHRGLPMAKLFTDLDQVEVGDQFFITVLDQTIAYEVDEIEVVAPSETRSLAIKRGQDLATLVTCTPYGLNTDRLLVHGHRVPYELGDEDALVMPHASFVLKVLAQLACIAAGLALALGLRKIVNLLRSRR